jgi:Niemann-Pick C1 protein
LAYLHGAGSQHKSNVQWASEGCNDDDAAVRAGSTCVVAAGLEATRLSATIDMDFTDRGQDRYDCMVAMRSEVGAIVEGAFPFSFEFMYWEEVGVIGTELRRNLLISGGVITIIVALLVQKARISALVIAAILFSITDVIGFLYYWDVTISGVSTIYVLICVGLAVDYSAHMAHMFKESTGTSQERTRKALGRIGPSVANAIISTLLAVIVIGFSKSYVFRIFFKAFFLVTLIAGAHGLWLLPVLLGLFGGSNIKASGALAGETGTKLQVFGV